jgi:dihydrofolate reductase
MGKIIMMLSMSLDGFIEGPNREIDWHQVDDEFHTAMNRWLATKGAFLQGRVTHELMVSVWPTVDQESDSPEPMKEFSRIWLDMPKFVYSRTLQHADWNTTVVSEVRADEVRELTRRFAGDLVVGGPTLAAEFRALDLIDEYRVFVHPVLIGAGKPLFGPAEVRTPLELTESHTFGNGVVLMHYRRSS